MVCWGNRIIDNDINMTKLLAYLQPVWFIQPMSIAQISYYFDENYVIMINRKYGQYYKKIMQTIL